jgi:hypothetical protein
LRKIGEDKRKKDRKIGKIKETERLNGEREKDRKVGEREKH